MQVDSGFFCQCLVDTLDGLRDGLTHFSGPSRAAVLIAMEPDAPVRVFDPQHLLRGHEPRFKELFLDSEKWRTAAKNPAAATGPGEILPEKNLGLAGLISCGGRSGSVFFQMWFTEHHPDMCAIGPTECWLEHAVWRFSHDMAHAKQQYTGISGFFLREYATHAVRDYLVDQLNLVLGMDTRLRIYPVLDAVLTISRTREEKAWPRGELVFIEPARLPEIRFMVRFSGWEQPALTNNKHVRKLLQAAEDSDRRLISDGSHIVGIAREAIPEYAIVADYRGGHGFIRLKDQLVCSFSDGAFKSTTHQAKLVQLEEALLECEMDPSRGHLLFKIVAELVHFSQQRKHGATVVIDLNQTPLRLSGQKLTQPLDLQDPDLLELAKSLTKVDGALHIGRDLKLHGFACLLDGRTVPGEDRSRGARFNSALRFTAELKSIIVVVVSVDHGVSTIQGGVEVSAQCLWKPVSSCINLPPTLAEWVSE
jgi:DNA integrity scanning protein DisA with diadenylate cyclase activity